MSPMSAYPKCLVDVTMCAYLVVAVMWCPVCSINLTLADANALAEFFTATRFANKTPVTVSNGCTEWPENVDCSFGVVQALDFPFQTLSGTLPPTLAQFSSLQRVDLSHNNLTGSIPREYRSWTAITSFRVAFNNLSGELPSELGNWTIMYTFLVNDNNLHGTLPPEFGNFKMAVVSFANNHLTGTLPVQYASTTRLTSFNVSHNSLSGSLPGAYGSWGGSIETLLLSNNQFFGTIPESWGAAMVNLRTLDVSHNTLVGPLVPFVDLTTLLASGNDFTGSLPVGAAMPQLTLLSVENNSRLSGPLLLSSVLYAGVCGTSLCLRSAVVALQTLFMCPPVTVAVSSANAKLVAAAYPYSPPSCNAAPTPTNPASTVGPSLKPQDETRPGTVVQVATASALYVSFAATNGAAAGRGVVPSLQRSAAALRIAAACDKGLMASGNSSVQNMFADLSDNPLGASVPVGVPALAFAAGAAVVNAAVACAISGLLHLASAMKEKCSVTFVPSENACSCPCSSKKVLSTIIALIPSSRFPGSLAIPIGTLLLPSVGACVALAMSTHRNAQTVVCGVGVLLGWSGMILYYVWSISWRGRRAGRFVLKGAPTAVHHRRRPRRLRLGFCSSSVLPWLSYATIPQHAWEVRHSDRPLEVQAFAHFVRENLEAVFGGYTNNREWFFAVEWGLTFVSGLLTGVAEVMSREGDACFAATWSSWCFLVISLAEIIAYALLRPQSIRLELWAAIGLNALGALCAALTIAGATDAAASVLCAASIIEILVVGLLMLVDAFADRRSPGSRVADKEHSAQIAAATTVVLVETATTPCDNTVQMTLQRLTTPARPRKDETRRTACEVTEQLFGLVALICSRPITQ